MSVIRTEELTMIYKKETRVPVKALEEVSFSVEKGEFSAVVGPSGSGKTTLLNLVGGLDKPTAGDVWIDGSRLSTMSDGERTRFRLQNIGFVFQAFNLIPVLSARENVEFIMLLQHCSAAERRERALELLEAVGLADQVDRRPPELSGGQQQRVAVARALASRPRFVLADEPTANLDTETADNLLDVMAELNRKYETTFIFSTHDQRVVERARRVITLRDGQITGDEQQE